MDASSTRFMITLVHGTFAKGAAWTQEGSTIRKAIQERLGEHAVFKRFDWSARNTHSARLAAGRELAQFLDRGAKENPGARNVVITHSHGGNVAIYACKHAAPESVSDIVFLATPFIRCRERVRVPLLAYVGLLPLSLLFGIYLSAILSMPIDWLMRVSSPYLPSGYIANQVLGWSVVLVCAAVCFWALSAYLKRSARRRIETLSWPAAAHVNTLCVYYRTDEAKGYLSALNWGTTRVARLMWMLIGLTVVVYFAYVGATEFVKANYPSIYESIVFSTPRMWWGEGPVIRRGSWYEFIGYMLLVFVPIAMLIAYALPLLRGHPLGYGWELPSSTVAVDVDVISEPVGFLTASSDSIGVDIGDAKFSGLVHSYVYEDARILSKIADWLTRR
jgi:hypothetical protein